MEPFATVADYESRYGPVDDEARLSVLLGDATAFISAQPGFDAGGEDRAPILTAVTCGVVHRSLSAGQWAGLSAVSQGGDGYTASATVYNPAGDFFLTKQERRVLGIGGGRVGATDPYGGGRGD